jgi:hypothetical protein
VAEGWEEEGAQYFRVYFAWAGAEEKAFWDGWGLSHWGISGSGMDNISIGK